VDLENLNLQTESSNSFDLSIGDLMAALLLIMILVLAGTLLRLNQQFNFKADYDALFEAIEAGLGDKLEDWNAILDKERLAVRFQEAPENEPRVLFEKNKATVQPGFRKILDEFVPLYFDILRKYQKDISEIRIEGHTANPGGSEDYFEGIELSQERTNNVLKYILQDIKHDKSEEYWTGELEWAVKLIVANGFSHSRPVLDDGIPNWDASRRVEFRVRTNAEERIRESFPDVAHEDNM
jgi:outer membrane protein OmpA-like peptidoglycan-associated protein